MNKVDSDTRERPLIVRIAVNSSARVGRDSGVAQAVARHKEEVTKRVEVNESGQRTCQTKSEPGRNEPTSPSQGERERKHQTQGQGHLASDRTPDTTGGQAASAESEEAAACRQWSGRTCELSSEANEEKASRLSWLAKRSYDRRLNAASANQLKRRHHLSCAASAAANSHCISIEQQQQQRPRQSQVEQQTDLGPNSNEAGARWPIESQVAAANDDNERNRSANNEQGGAVKPPARQDVEQLGESRSEKDQARAQIEIQSHSHSKSQSQSQADRPVSSCRAASEQPSSSSPQDHLAAAITASAIDASADSGGSLLFWKFLSNLPRSITQRGGSSPGLAPEVAGYLAQKERQQKCDTMPLAPKKSSTSSASPQDADHTNDRPPPYDGSQLAAAAAANQQPHQDRTRHLQQPSQEMVVMNYSGGDRGSAAGSRVIRIVAPASQPGPAQTTGQAHDPEASNYQHHHHHHHHQQPQSPIKDRNNQNEHEQQQHLQANRTKLSIASSRTTTRSSATSLSSCILSDSSGSEVVRLKWGKKMDFLLSIIGFAVDLANIWRFPYLVYKNGGGVFLIPYLTMLIFGGIPLFFLELCLGQFVKKGPITVWNKICPSMKGVGYCSIMISWYVSFYYNVLIAWSVYFIYRSLLSSGEKMPWEDCDNSWNSKGTCVSISQLKELCSHRDVSLETCRKDLFDNVNVTSPASEFFVKELSQIDQSTGLDDMGYLRWELVICTMIVYLLHYFSLFRGLETSGKVVWVTATAPYMILSILLVRGLFLPGATMGIKYYLSPRLEKLADPQVWIDAAGQVFYSIGVGFGVHLTYASFNSHNNNCYRDCLMTSAVNALTSVYSGLVVFVYLGYMAKNLGIEIDKVASEGYSLVFEVYPEALTTLPFARFWSILFFIMLLTLGIDSAMGGLEAVITGLEDEFRFARRLSRGQLTGLVIFSSFLPALISCTQGGAYTLFWFDIYSAGVSLLFSALFETIGVVYCYGLDKFIPNIESMLGRKPPLFYILCWRYISPIFLGGVIFMSIYTAGVPTYRGYTFPLWSIILGWCLAFSSVAAIPIVAIWYWANRWLVGPSSDKSVRKRDRCSTSVAV